VALYYPTALATVQDALLDLVALGYRVRDGAVDDRDALARVLTLGADRSNAIPDRSLRFVAETGCCWIFRRWSQDEPSEVCVAAADRGSRPGRWLRTASPIQTTDGSSIAAVDSGYLKNVALWTGEIGGKDWDQRILAARPAVILKYRGEDKDWITTPRGKSATKLLHFELWAVSLNYRLELEAAIGPALSDEKKEDPGVARIMGDLENLLDGVAGTQLDIHAGRDSKGLLGFDCGLVGPTTPAVEDFAGSEFIWTAPFDVRVTVHRQAPTQPPLDVLTAQGVTDALKYPVDTIIPEEGAPDATA